MGNRLRRFGGLSLALVGLLLPGLGARDARETSERFSFATYRAVEDRLTVLVGSFQASLRDEDRYIPIPVAIGLDGKGPRLTVTPESFTLIDQAGAAYPAAAYGEVVGDYGKLSFDRTILRARPLAVGLQFEGALRLGSNFYPPTGAGLRIPRVQLSRSTWFADVIYFPRPASGLGGVLTLRFEPAGSDAPVDVHFQVPLRGGRG